LSQYNATSFDMLGALTGILIENIVSKGEVLKAIFTGHMPRILERKINLL